MKVALVAVATLVVLASAPAHGQEPRVQYDHKGQVGLHAAIGTGYRVIFPYEGKMIYCGQTVTERQFKPVCTGRLPTFLEVGLSYAAGHHLELLADLRLGIQKDFAPAGPDAEDPRPLATSAGIKFLMDDAGSSKFFSTLQVVLDFTDFQASGVEPGTDVGIRNANGLLFDVHETFGVYLHVGETIGFMRWFRFEMDLGVGIQARYP